MDLSEKIKSEINENPIILYMKGTKAVSYTHLTLPTNREV